jgi:hypothetical protein
MMNLRVYTSTQALFESLRQPTVCSWSECPGGNFVVPPCRIATFIDLVNTYALSSCSILFSGVLVRRDDFDKKPPVNFSTHLVASSRK